MTASIRGMVSENDTNRTISTFRTVPGLQGARYVEIDLLQLPTHDRHHLRLPTDLHEQQAIVEELRIAAEGLRVREALRDAIGRRCRLPASAVRGRRAAEARLEAAAEAVENDLQRHVRPRQRNEQRATGAAASREGRAKVPGMRAHV